MSSSGDSHPTKQSSRSTDSPSKKKSKRKASKDKRSDAPSSAASAASSFTSSKGLRDPSEYSLEEEWDWQEHYATTARALLPEPEAQEPLLTALSNMVHSWVDHVNEEFKNGADFSEQMGADWKELHVATGRDQLLWLNPRTHSDLGLLHYLRKYRYKVDPALEAVKVDIFWRCSRNSDCLEEQILDNPLLPAFDDYLPFAWHGVDKLGKRVFYLRMGMVDVRHLMSVPLGDCYDYVNLQFEYLQRNIYRQSPPEAALDATCIIDCAGLSFRNVYEMGKHTSFARSVTGIPQLHYPDLLNKGYVINAPPLVQRMWSFAQKFMTHSVRRIVFLDKPEDLLEFIDADQLPVEFGGSADVVIDMPGETLNVPTFTKVAIGGKKKPFAIKATLGKKDVLEFQFYTIAHKVLVEVTSEHGVVQEAQVINSEVRSCYKRIRAKKSGEYTVSFELKGKSNKSSDKLWYYYNVIPAAEADDVQ